MLTVAPHSLLVPSAFTTTFAAPLGELGGGAIAPLLSNNAEIPLTVSRSSDALRAAVRDLLRAGGFKPTGRSKPASEYLIKAAEGGFLGPINPAVDACNAVSLHTGFPISVVDLDRVVGDMEIRVAPAESEYVFNASGQTIDIDGLLCLFDGQGPWANAVKDAQRTKTHAGTVRTLSVLWGVRGHEGALAAATDWYRALLAAAGATTVAVIPESPSAR